ncbi:MAG TPA: HAMP domain-containing sensor histidine kinase [Candidatus Paceibacterota bacterium]
MRLPFTLMRSRPGRVLDAMLLSAGAELTLASAAAFGGEWLPDGDEATFPLLCSLFLVCMLLFFGNRCGRTKAAFGGFAAASSIATVVVSVRSVDCWLWLALSAAVLVAAAVVAFGPRALIARLFKNRVPRRELARLAVLGESSARLFHDLVNPLTAVSLAVAELGASGGAPAAHARVEQALRAARKLEDQVARARKYAKPSGMRVVFSIRAELADIIDSLSAHARRADCRVTLAASAALMTYGDPFQFYRALSNIILNSIESCEGREAGTVAVSAAARGRRVVIRVEDTGCGMDARTLAKSRRASFTTKRGGTGFGLPIALDTLEYEFGARVTYESEVNAGTRTTISIPIR